MVSPFMSGGNTSPLSVSIYEAAIKELNRKGNNGKDICVELIKIISNEKDFDFLYNMRRSTKLHGFFY